MNPLFALLESVLIRGHTIRATQPDLEKLEFVIEVICGAHGNIVASCQSNCLEEAALGALSTLVMMDGCTDDDEFDGGNEHTEDTKH